MKKAKNITKDNNLKNKKQIKIVLSWEELNSKIKKSFIKKYSIKPIKYDIFVLENIIYNRNCHITSIFKDKMIMNNREEYLKKVYTKKESKEKIKKFHLYYDNYLMFFCKPIFSEIYLNKLFLKFYEKKAEIFYNENLLKKEFNNCPEKNLSMNSDTVKNEDNKNIKKDKIFFDTTVVKAIDGTVNKNNDSELTINTLNLNDNYPQNSSLVNNGNRLITEFSEDKSFASLIGVMNKNNKDEKNKTNLKLKLENRVNHVNENIKKRNRIKNNSLLILNTNKTSTFKKFTNINSNRCSKFCKDKGETLVDKNDIRQNGEELRLNKKNSMIPLSDKKLKKDIEKIFVNPFNNMIQCANTSNNNTINAHSNKMNSKVNSKFTSYKTLIIPKKRNLTKNKNEKKNNNNNIKCLSTLNLQSIKTIESPSNGEINSNKHVICSKHLSLPRTKCTKAKDNFKIGLINHLEKNTINAKWKNYSQPEIITSCSNKSCRQESMSKNRKSKIYSNLNYSQPIIETESNEQININNVHKRKNISDKVVIIDYRYNMDNNEIAENNDNPLLYTSVNIGNVSQDQTKNSIYLKGKIKKNNLSIDSTYSNKERENTNANTYTNTNNVLINSYKASFISSKRNSTKKIKIITHTNSNRIKNNILNNEKEIKNNLKKNKCISKKSNSNGKQYIINSYKNKAIKCNLNHVDHINQKENKLPSSNMNIINTSGNKLEINNKIISNKLSSLSSNNDLVKITLNESNSRNLTISKQKKSSKKIINVESHKDKINKQYKMTNNNFNNTQDCNLQKTLYNKKEKVSLNLKTESTANGNNRFTTDGLLDGRIPGKNNEANICYKKESISIKNSRNKCNTLNLINQKMKKSNHDVKDIKFLTNSINSFKSKFCNVTNNTNVINTNINIDNKYGKSNLNGKERTKKVMKKQS